MNEIQLKRGDRRPPLEAVLAYDDGQIIDLTGATVSLLYRPAGDVAASTISRSITVVNPTSGLVSYSWAAEDASQPAGRYWAEFEIDYSGEKLTVPTTGYVPMIIYEDLA